MSTEKQLREQLVQQARSMNTTGLNQGTAGNLSVRCGDCMLITPSSLPYDRLQPEHIVNMPLDNPAGAWQGTHKPSSEWRLHLAILRSRPDIHAIIHAHSPFATALSITRQAIPAIHYMIVLFGGDNIRCSDYATFGTAALSSVALQALQERNGCLLANHGMLAISTSLEKAMWLAVELETLAKQYCYALQMGQPVLLTAEQLAEAKQQFVGYGLQ